MQTAEDRLEAFAEHCRKAGLKATHQRTEIYRELAATTEHPDADTVHAGVRQRIPALSLDTVYRTLRLLEQKGVIMPVGSLGTRTRFDANLEPHHHFVCIKCGVIRDFSSASLNKVNVPQEAKHFGKPTAVQVEVKGICSQCQEGIAE
jgi:Fur family peroxide stress response transcriptional regulator